MPSPDPPAVPPSVPPAVPPSAPSSEPAIDLTTPARAARRSGTGGVWSLGHLPICWAALILGGGVLAVIAALTAGGRAALGVGIGTGIVGAFFTVSAVVIAQAGQRNPRMVMPAALGTYLAKVIALGIVLVMMPRDGAVDTRWMAGAIGLGLVCWLGAHMRYVWTTKIFYVDPS